ncbi:hypothetical protein V8C43DRAFT_268029 [Trichoderma afarasin]
MLALALFLCPGLVTVAYLLGFGITRNSIGTASFSLIAHTSTDCSAFPNSFLALKALCRAYSVPPSKRRSREDGQ